MFYTTVPAALVCLVVYFIADVLEWWFHRSMHLRQNEMTEGLGFIYHFNVFLLLPGGCAGWFSDGKPTIPVGVYSIGSAGVLRIVFQGATVAALRGHIARIFFIDAGIDPKQ